MTDSRKVLESIPEPASLDRTMPAPPQPARDGANIGGIAKTAESGLRDDQTDSGEVPQATPNTKQTSSGHRQPPVSKPTGRPTSADNDDARADAKTPEDESALESLGRAIGTALDGEAAEKEPRR